MSRTSTAALKVTTPSELEIVMTRTFHASRPLVWNAMTKPEHLRRWLFAPPGWTMSNCEMDVRVGGQFRWVWKGPDGRVALTITGEHREVMPPARLVHTEHMVMGPGAGGCDSQCEGEAPWELLATIELTEERSADGTLTHLRMTLLFPTKDARDMALASGMEQGVGVGYDTLDRMLAEGAMR